MSFAITDIVNKISNGLQKPSLFTVNITSSTGNNFNSDGGALSFLCKASSIPSFSVTGVEIDFWGRKYFVPGDRNFTHEWSTKVIADHSWNTYKNIHKWLESMNDSTQILNNVTFTNVSDIKGTANVSLYSSQAISTNSSEAKETIKFKLHGIFPTSLEEIQVDWSSQNTLLEYNVTWKFDYVTIEK